MAASIFLSSQVSFKSVAALEKLGLDFTKVSAVLR